MFTQIKWVESGKALKALGGLFDRRIFGIFDRHGEEARLSSVRVILDIVRSNTGLPVMCLNTKIDSASATLSWRSRPLLAISEYFC